MKEFIFNPEKHVLGTPCKHGHKGYRYISTNACCECLKISFYKRGNYYKMYNIKKSTSPKHLAVRMLGAARQRQRKKNKDAPFNLTKEWIRQKIENGRCEATGIEFDLSPVKDTSRRAFSPALDKKDPSKFYTMDNCQVVCNIYNIAKGEFSQDDLMRLVNALSK